MTACRELLIKGDWPDSLLLSLLPLWDGWLDGWMDGHKYRSIALLQYCRKQLRI